MAKTKDEHIEYWLASAEMDLDTSSYLLKGEKICLCLFFCHLAIEKICKALWVKNNEENVLPKIHNIARILEFSRVEIADEFLIIITELNKFQIEGRYQSDLVEMFGETQKTIALKVFKETKIFKEWLLKKMQ